MKHIPATAMRHINAAGNDLDYATSGRNLGRNHHLARRRPRSHQIRPRPDPRKTAEAQAREGIMIHLDATRSS